jgi:hypothetical protein
MPPVTKSSRKVVGGVVELHGLRADYFAGEVGSQMALTGVIRLSPGLIEESRDVGGFNGQPTRGCGTA